MLKQAENMRKWTEIIEETGRKNEEMCRKNAETDRKNVETGRKMRKRAGIM